MEFGGYLPLRNDNSYTLNTGDEGNTSAFWPIDPTAAAFDSAHNAVNIPYSGWKNGYKAIGVRLRQNALFCTYFTNAGVAGIAPTGAVGAGILGTPTTPWFYTAGACNLHGPSGTWPGNLQYMVLTSQSLQGAWYNDGS